MKGESILVIDDDDVFRKRLARAFIERGIDAGETSNTNESCQYVQRKKPNKVVLDLKIGSESGLVLLRKLLEIDSSLEIVVLTGYGTISTAVEAIKLGAINYITKPVDADTLIAAFKGRTDNCNTQIKTPFLSQVEWDHIQRVVSECGGNITKASKALGMHRRSLQRKLSKNPTKLR